MGRAARAKAQIKVRQPVAEVVVKLRDAAEAAVVERNRHLVLEELNAKALRIVEDETAVVAYDVKPNLPVLGPKHGQALGAIRQGLAAMDPAEVAAAVRRGRAITVAGIELEPGDILLQAQDREGYAAAQEAGYTVAVATAITPELADEGLAREIVRRLQDLRREAGFELADRIIAWVAGDADVARVLDRHGGYIRGETLALELRSEEPPADATRSEDDLEGTRVVFGVRRAG
ncbi:MAG: DUF5915 domain-containing protein [Dehalococcoidia bacterium]|nr:DUF5915 domain-containing protein [Dehalococcoidia bacterium]